MARHKKPRTTYFALTVIVFGAVFALGAQLATAAEELRLILAPRSTLLTAEGTVQFDVYLYNDSDKRRGAAAPDAEFQVVWTLRDTDKNRPERQGSHLNLGTDAAKRYVLNPREAVNSLLMHHFESEPGDLLEFHISVDTKLKTGEVKTIKSNSVILYRPKADEAQR